MRFASFILVFSVALLAAQAVRAEPAPEGEFKGRGKGRLSLRVFALDDPPPVAGAYFVSLETAIPNRCTGEVTGIARRTVPGTLVLRKKPDAAGDTCEVTLRYTSDGKAVRIEENACSDLHGTECAFSGRLTKVLGVR